MHSTHFYDYRRLLLIISGCHGNNISSYSRTLSYHLCTWRLKIYWRFCIQKLLQGVSIACYASPVLARIGMSVCPSVTCWHWVKTTQAGIAKSSPTDSPRSLVFWKKVHPEIRKGSPRARAINESGVGKIHNFQPISRHISETVQDRTKVTIND